MTLTDRSFLDALRRDTEALRENGLYKEERVITSPQDAIIEVDGDRATGIWYIQGPWTETEGGKEIWMTARYDDDYVKINGEWKYQHLRGVVRMVADR